jgi:NDP-sugar pyrophosphorylase family protein
MLQPADFFDLEGFEHKDLFDPDQCVWQALASLPDWLAKWFSHNKGAIKGDVSPAANLHGDDIFIGEGTIVEDGVSITGPAIIGCNCEIRQGAYIRGEAVMGDGAILGHASELKGSILLNGAKAPHFAYVGDSILGAEVNLGAGTKLSNLAVSSEKDGSGRRPTIHIPIHGTAVDTGLTKLGAVIGDYSQTGCNVVTNPGTLIGKRTLIYAGTSLTKGYYEDNRIVKLRQTLEVVFRK